MPEEYMAIESDLIYGRRGVGHQDIFKTLTLHRIGNT